MKKISDLFGSWVSIKDLFSPQTGESKLGHLHKHIGDHPTRGLTPAKLASVLLEAEQGNLISQCELAEDIEEKDGHIFAELQKRRRALLGVDWRIVPPRDATPAEKHDAALIEQILTDVLDLDDVILDMSDAILKGFSNQELEWQRTDGLLVPKEITFRDPSWFQVHPDNRNQLRLRDNSYEGDALQPLGWISHTHKAKSGYLARSALVRVLAWPFLFKNLSVRDLAEFLEIYGLPVKLGRYPSGANDKEKSTLLRAVLSIGHNAGGIIPKGMDIEFKEAAEGGEGPFMAMINLAERTMSKAILGGTLTSGTGEGTNTNALGNVHNEVRVELRNSDLKQIANTLSRDLVYPLYALNCKTFRGPHRLPRFEFDISEPADLKHYADSLPPLIDRGMQVPQAWLHEQLQIPQPQGNEPVMQSSSSSPMAGLKFKPLAALKSAAAEPAPADLLAARLAQEAEPHMAVWIGQIEAMLEQAESLEEFKAMLLAAMPELSVDDLGTLLGDAGSAAQAAGRYDVEQGHE